MQGVFASPEVLATPITDAADMPVDEAAQTPVAAPHQRRRRKPKEAAVYGAFDVDPTDEVYCICQCTEIISRGICGKLLKYAHATTLWKHVARFHPYVWRELRGVGSGDGGAPTEPQVTYPTST